MTSSTQNNSRMRDGPSEERHPLLLFLVKDEPNPISARSKGYYEGISTGATAVITQWPNHLASCWYCCLMIGLVCILFTILAFLSTVPNTYIIQQKCRNNALHMNVVPDDYAVYVVHGSTLWTRQQLISLESIANIYPNADIQILMIQSTNSQFQSVTPSTQKSIQKSKQDTDGTTWQLLRWIIRKNAINGGNKQGKVRTFDQFAQTHNEIKYANISLDAFFANTPLYRTWTNLNYQMQLFAVRVILLWNSGGIAFDLPASYGNATKNRQNETLSKQPTDKIVLKHHDDNSKILQSEFISFVKMADDAVRVDVNGIHMETKATCHAFFGEILVKLMRADATLTPSDIIQQAIEKFCAKSQVDQDYCRRIKHQS